MKFTEPTLDDLISLIARLPGFGPKSARRISLYLIKNKENLMKPLSDSLKQVYKNIVRCNVCGNLKSIDTNCDCDEKNYDQICVVENIVGNESNEYL